MALPAQADRQWGVGMVSLPHQGVTTSPTWAIVQHILQGQGEFQPLSLRDVEVSAVVAVAHTHKHLVLGGICDVILLWKPKSESEWSKPQLSSWAFYTHMNTMTTSIPGMEVGIKAAARAQPQHRS